MSVLVCGDSRGNTEHNDDFHVAARPKSQKDSMLQVLSVAYSHLQSSVVLSVFVTATCCCHTLAMYCTYNCIYYNSYVMLILAVCTNIIHHESIATGRSHGDITNCGDNSIQLCIKWYRIYEGPLASRLIIYFVLLVL